jgi:hypothetical protein
MAKKKGKIPTLVSSSSGAAEYIMAQRRRVCKRCEVDIHLQEWCAQVKIPGGFSGHKTFCITCFKEILGKTEKDLAELKKGPTTEKT